MPCWAAPYVPIPDTLRLGRFGARSGCSAWLAPTPGLVGDSERGVACGEFRLSHRNHQMRHNGTMSRHGGTLLLILAFALAACGGEGEAAIDTVSALPEGRTVAITSIDMSADHRTMTLGFIGHAHPDDSPCSEDYEGWARANGEVVEAAVIVTREAGGGVCTQAGLSREVVVELAEPFTGSVVRDAVGDFVLFLVAPEGSPPPVPPQRSAPGTPKFVAGCATT